MYRLTYFRLAMGHKVRETRVVTFEQLQRFIRALEGLSKWLPARSVMSRAFTVEKIGER